MLFRQPLARAIDLQARRADYRVCQSTCLGVRQRRSKWWIGAAPLERGVVGHAHIDPEQGGEQAQQTLDLPSRTAEGQAQQASGLHCHLRVVVGTATLSSVGQAPRRKRLRHDPDYQAPTLLQRPVAVRLVGDLCAWEILWQRASRVLQGVGYAENG